MLLYNKSIGFKTMTNLLLPYWQDLSFVPVQIVQSDFHVLPMIVA